MGYRCVAAPRLPAPFTDTVARIFGAVGRAWLAELPDLVARCITHWRLEDVQPVAELSINYLAYAVTPEGQPVVLKIGPSTTEVAAELIPLLTLPSPPAQ